MEIRFATSCVATAEKYIDQTDCSAIKNSKEAVLAAVEQEKIRIGDPMMYGKEQLAIFPGDKWDKEKTQEEFNNFFYGLLKTKSPDPKVEAKIKRR